MVVSLMILLVVVASVRFIPMANANNAGVNQAHPVKGKVVEVTRNTMKVLINGHEYTLIMHSSLSKNKPNMKFFLVRAGDVSKEVSNTGSVQVYKASKSSSSKFNKITVIEPDVLKANVPISGTVQPGIL